MGWYLYGRGCLLTWACIVYNDSDVTWASIMLGTPEWEEKREKFIPKFFAFGNSFRMIPVLFLFQFKVEQRTHGGKSYK